MPKKGKQIEPVLVKFKKLEILVKPETVQKYRNDKLKLNDVIISDVIYMDAKKARQASQTDLENNFDFKGPNEKYLDHILRFGTFNLTTAEKRGLNEARMNALINHFASEYVDPKTNIPHSPELIRSTFQKMKVHGDYTLPFDKQVNEAYKKILGTLILKKR